MFSTRTYLKDLGERVVVTFLEAFVSSIVYTELTDRAMWQAAAIGGGAAVLSLLKGVAAKWRGLPDSASLSKEV